MPPALSIPLGASGSSVDVVKNEDGTFSANGEVITAATRVTAANGNVYRALLSPEGMPIGVEHVAAMVDVMLGDLGGTLNLTQKEDKSWVITSDGTPVMDGYVYTAANGNDYKLMMDAHDDHGHWTAVYQEVMVTVTTGTQGSVTLTRAENMSWSLAGELVMTGSMYNSANGNEYMLIYADGTWSAEFQPVSMMIEGTGLTAMTREGDDMYDVGDATLDASGVGNVTDDGAMYRVWMTEDGLAGARYDVAIKDKTAAGPTDAGGRLLTDAAVALSKNDPDTVANEAATMLVVAGEEYPVGTLLGGGSVSKTGATFVEKARAEVEKLAGQVKALADLNASLDREDRSDYSTVIKLKWGDAQKAVDSIFGKSSPTTSKITLPTLSERSGRVDESRAVDDFNELLDALASADMFEAALDDGILEDGAKTALNNETAAAVFGAVKSESAAMLGATETTRYGVFASQGRNVATDDLKFTVAGADTDDHQGAIGAFAYSLVDDTVRTSHLPSSGTASYEGGTKAVSGGRDPELYSGLFSMEVNFPTRRVTALITNLQDEQGDAWQYQLRDVESIYFPGVNLDGQAHFNASKGYQAKVTHFGFAAQPVSGGDTQFEGWLLGAGRDEEAGTGAFGTWSLGNRQNAGASYLVGSFGAERTDVRPTDRPSVGAAVSESWVTAGNTADAKFFKQGGTVFLPLAGNEHPDNEGEVYEIDLATLEKDGAGGKTLINGNRKIDDLRREIQGELAKLEGFVAVDGADDTIGDDHLSDRSTIWGTINKRILEVVFGVDAADVDDIYQNGKMRPNYDAELSLRPADSVDPDPDSTTAASRYYVDDATVTGNTANSYDDGEEVTLNKRMKLTALSTGLYPGLTATNAGKPNDDAARQEIEAVLDALTNGTTLGAALGEGGLFEGLLAETRTLYRDENYDGYADVKNGKRLISDAKAGQAWGLRTFKTHVQLGTTDYTRFGITWAKSSTSSFAYSPLPQVQYANASAPGYPGGAKATYSGSTVLRGAGNTPYEGTVDVDVSWDADTIGESLVTVTFSELAKVADSEPFSIGYILVDGGSNGSTGGHRYLRNGRTTVSTQGLVDYHAYETAADGGKYRGIDDTQQVRADGTALQPGATPPNIAPDTVPATGNSARRLQLSKDPRNGFADMVRFDVDEIVFRSNIKVTNDGEMLAFATSSAYDHDGDTATADRTTALADVDIVWADRSFENTSLAALTTGSPPAPTGRGGSIEGEFVGQGTDGPLAAMGIWSFVAPTGVLNAKPVGPAITGVSIGGAVQSNLYPGWNDGTVEFAAVDTDGSAMDRFDPNSLSGFTGNIVHGVVGPVAGATDSSFTDTYGNFVDTVIAADGKKTTLKGVATGAAGYLQTTVTKGTVDTAGVFTQTDGSTATVTYGTTLYGAFGTGP